MEIFDQTRFRLGTLCQRGHDFSGSGKSLRYVSGASPCVTCAIDYRRTRDAKKRAARLAAAPKYPVGMKKCPACEVLIPVGEWRCKPCATAYRTDHRAKNHAKQRSQAKLRQRKARVSKWHLTLWRGARSSAKTRKLAHEISPEHLLYLWDAQGGRCYWSNVPMLIDAELGHLLRVSIDRIDPALGYQEGNVALACMFVNIGRRNRSPEETLAALGAIAKAF